MSRYAIGMSLVLLAGCGSEFALPEGDVQRGREAFVALHCNSCHSVGDVERVDAGHSPAIDKKLGGAVTRVKSYEDLVTSIINPSHRLSLSYPEERSEIAYADGRSRMPNYNIVMTVQQLVDLVAFLQPEYQVRLPRSDYPIYYP
ncbi:MAG: cytochrome c [Pseudomonadales bacterium]